MTGSWFEIARDKSSLIEYGRCNKAQFSINSKNGEIIINNTYVSPLTGLFNYTTATAKCIGTLCDVKFYFIYKVNYQVLSTDYNSYALIYKCEDFLFAKREKVWIYSRTMALPSDRFATAKDIILKETSFNLESFIYTVQGLGCIYYPGY